MQNEEKKPEKKAINPAQKVARILLKVVLFLLLFIVVVFLLILTPPAQRFLSGKVESYLQNKLKTEVEIGGISFGLSGNVNLKDIYIEDRAKDTLLSGALMTANINIPKLLSNQIEIKNLAFKNVTAKVKRLLPDTVFNFQFIVDAFATQPTTVDTTAAAPLMLDISDVELDNVRFIYNDAVTGNDVTAYVDAFNAEIDSMDVNTLRYSIPTIEGRGITATIKQSKPLVTPEPASKDLQEAVEAPVMDLSFGEIDLRKIKLEYTNNISALYANVDLGRLNTKGKSIDLPNRKLHFENLLLNNSTVNIKLGNDPDAKVVEKEIEKEVEVQATLPWGFRIDNIELTNNQIQFDNDNEPRLAYGLDYAHMNADDLNLQIKNLVVNDDSISAVVTKGSFKEKSGFQLDELRGELLYANTQSYLKDFYLKTPGTELKREVLLQYASYEALAKEAEKTTVDIDVPDSYVQVKDILVFAPQLRSQPAFSNPNDVWHLNLRASGNMDRLHLERLQFEGFGNTQIDADGTLASLTNPNAAGGTLTIRRFHTTQSDIALLTGQSLASQPLNLPQSVDIHGTLAGNMSRLNTDLVINTSSGNLDVDGSFSNLANPTAATYNATVSTQGLQLGSILRNPQMGSLSATLTANGKGFTPDAINTSFKGNIHSFGFNNYTYRNIALNGSIQRNNFNVRADANDPNAHFDLTAKGNLSTQSFQIAGFVDSLKTLPLHFTTQPLVFRGQINADVPSVSPDHLEANVLITQALLVSGTNRLPLDSLQLVSGRSDTGQYIRLTSDIMNAQLAGQYRFGDLGYIIQNNIQPYFSTTPNASIVNVQPYNFSFNADVAYHPIYAAFVPGLTNAETIHAEGKLATGQGMQASVNAPYILMGPNEINGLNVTVNTADSGMNITGTVGRFKSGSSFDLYNTRLSATALNNNINFNLRMGDKADRDRYILAGLLTQPSVGDMRISLQPDNLLLNYERWTITPNNSISIIDNNILANNFVLQKDNQQLSLQSAGISGNQPLNVTFTNFRLATITGFIKADSSLVDGTMNGNVSLRNLMQQPVFTSQLTIENLSFRQDTIGNMNLSVTSAGNSYNTNLTLTGNGNDLALTGSFAPQGNDIALNLDMAIRQLQLNTFEGAMADFVSSARGGITGNVSIDGTASQPKIQGTLNFDTATISTKVLGGPLTIDNETLTVTENGIAFNSFSIRDSANNALTLNGNIATSNFINYNFSLDVDARNFRAVNSTKKDNKLFYGDLVISTNLHIGGTETAPVVDGSLTVNNGTAFSIVIPQAEPSIVSREGVVQFVDFDNPANDSLFLAAYDSLNVSNLLGFDVSTNITIQKEAIFNIIVDVANGDFLNIRGTGQLSAGVDPSGKISLTGSYEIEEGAYQLSMNFLQRKFTIQKGSKLVWMGEPTNAEVDITAVYIANTAPIDLVEGKLADPANDRNYFLQRLPFEVSLKLTGELMKPEIAFDIALPADRNYNVGGEVIPTVTAELARLRQQPTELNKQVFAILLLNRFVGENPFESSAGGFDAGTLARQSVSKLLTEQLNNLAGGLVSGVDLNFDVASSNDYSTGEKRSRTDLNVGLSKRLLNDRLTVTVGSNFQLEGPQQANQSSNNVAGNVSVNYQLSKDGRYLVRFYRKNEYEGTVDGYIIETGLGFIMSVDYNRFVEILHAKRIRQQREQRQQQRQENNQNQKQ